MKKSILLLSAITAALVVNANHTIVIHPDSPQGNTKTEVGVIGDTISVMPSMDVTAIEVSVKNDEGYTVSQEIVPANEQSSLTVPTLPMGYLLEIRDDNGLIYQEAN